jgi:hypothetical protein
MHLRDVNGTEVSISVDVVDTTKELLEGEDPSAVRKSRTWC